MSKEMKLCSEYAFLGQFLSKTDGCTEEIPNRSFKSLADEHITTKQYLKKYITLFQTRIEIVFCERNCGKTKTLLRNDSYKFCS